MFLLLSLYSNMALLNKFLQIFINLIVSIQTHNWILLETKKTSSTIVDIVATAMSIDERFLYNVKHLTGTFFFKPQLFLTPGASQSKCENETVLKASIKCALN